MKKATGTGLGVLLAVFLMGASSFAQQDVKGSKDHPLLTRMPDFYISSYSENEFDKEGFYDESDKYIYVEGRTFRIEYKIKTGAKPPTNLQIVRNYENAIQQIGGKVAQRGNERSGLRVNLKDKEVWVAILPFSGGQGYKLNIVEKEGMRQDVIADADAWMKDIGNTGHAAVYGIYFDFNKSDVKPESEPALQEISKLLSGNATVKVFIIGHTDNVGGVDFNMKLSQARAEAVVKVLTTKYKINPQRLKAYGVGQLAPVAPNKTEDGRAKNRRVELVEQ